MNLHSGRFVLSKLIVLFLKMIIFNNNYFSIIFDPSPQFSPKAKDINFIVIRDNLGQDGSGRFHQGHFQDRTSEDGFLQDNLRTGRLRTVLTPYSQKGVSNFQS